MPESICYASEPESGRANRLRVWSDCEDLQRETDPAMCANTALSFAEAATTLARLETEATPKFSLAPSASSQ